MKITAFQKNVVTMLVAPTIICTGFYIADKAVKEIDKAFKKREQRKKDEILRNLTVLESDDNQNWEQH